MIIKTTPLGFKIIEQAEEMLKRRIIAPKNKGKGLEELIKEFDANGSTSYYAGSGKPQIDYCGATASVILDNALQHYSGQTNTFRSASAAEFINIAKHNGIRVDKKPAVGALFLTKRSGGSGRHVGVVLNVDGNTIDTVEGNTWAGDGRQISEAGCPILTTKWGVISRRRRVSEVKEFVHVEELGGTQIVEKDIYTPMLADGDMCELLPEPNPDAPGSEKTSDGTNQLINGIPNTYLYVGGGVIGLGILALIIKKYS